MGGCDGRGEERKETDSGGETREGTGEGCQYKCKVLHLVMCDMSHVT